MPIGVSPWPTIRCMVRVVCFKYIFVAICGFTFVSLLLRGELYDSVLTPPAINARRGQTSTTADTGHPDMKPMQDGASNSEGIPFHQPVVGSPMCPENPPGLGSKVTLGPDDSTKSTLFDDSKVSMGDLPRLGGWWQPSHCQANHHVAVIIPYRDRADNLRVLLRYLHPMLQRQLLHYRIFVAEQGRYPVYNCFIFHDVDMVPEDDRNLYMCQNQPKHLSPAVDKLNYTLPYKELIGGVLAITAEQFIRVNGYANVFWGWGGEDDDMFYRIRNKGYTIQRPPMHIGRYSMLSHVKRTWISHSKTYSMTRIGFPNSNYTDLGIWTISYPSTSVASL